MIGNVNAYIDTPISFKGRRLSYDGTIKGLVRVLLAAGGVAGDTFTDDQGRTRALIAAPGDPRGMGHWATSWNERV